MITTTDHNRKIHSPNDERVNSVMPLKVNNNKSMSFLFRLQVGSLLGDGVGGGDVAEEIGEVGEHLADIVRRYDDGEVGEFTTRRREDGEVADELFGSRWHRDGAGDQLSYALEDVGVLFVYFLSDRHR